MSFGNKFFPRCQVVLLAFFIFSEIKAEGKPDLSQNFELMTYPNQGPAVNTLRSEMFFVKNQASAWARLSPLYRTFYQKRSSGSVQILKDRPELNYHYWMQDNPADLLVIIPGTGENYVDMTPTAFANLFYNNGYSAVIISNAFNWEFMQAAGSVITPGYTPVDAADVRRALQMVIAEINKEYPGQIKRKVLIGSSMGALHTLFIADMDSKSNEMAYDRYIAVNPPVDLLYAMEQIDKYYAIGAKWKKDEIQLKMRKCIVSYMRMLKQVDADAQPIAAGINRRREVKMDVEKNKSGLIDFEQDEAQFMIGLSFHMNLMEVIYSIYSRQKMGVIKAKDTWFDRREIYAEIDKFNFDAYLHKFLLKEYEKRLNRAVSAESLGSKAGLLPVADTLQNNQKIRVIHNADDFLLRPGDMDWLRTRLGNRMTVFSHGGHLGNLYTRPVQDTMIKYAKQ